MDMVIDILGHIVLVMGAVGGAYAFVQWVRNSVLAPRIRMSYDPERTGDVAREIESNRKLVFYHVQVANPSSRNLERARAYISRAWKVSSDGTLMPWKDFRSKLPLPWANTGWAMTTELFPKEDARLDLLYMPVSSEFLAISTPQGATGTATVLPIGHYVLDVHCVAEKAKPGDVRVEVDFAAGSARPKLGEWKS